MLLQMVLLPVYYPSEDEARNPQLYASNVRALMARELGATVSDHGKRVPYQHPASCIVSAAEFVTLADLSCCAQALSTTRHSRSITCMST
jgi:hypothetical protein